MNGSLLVSDLIEQRYGGQLEALAPRVPRVVSSPEALTVCGGSAAGTSSAADGDAESALQSVETAFFSADLYPERAFNFVATVVRCPELRWLHTFSAGVDHPAFLNLLDNGIRLTHSGGSNSPPIAQTVMFYLLALARDLKIWADATARCAWERRPTEELGGRVLAVLGTGHIGAEVARLGAAFGMRVIGMRRRPGDSESFETWPVSRLDELLALADYLVVALPLNDESRGIIGAAQLARMKPEARIVNVGRGELIDEAALIEALQDGRIAGAALDVFAQEPLPPESPLWTLPNVIVTPHNAGYSHESALRSEQMWLENLRRYRAGEPLHNEVIKS